MPRSTNKEVALYLQWRVRQWVDSGRTAKELAKAAGVSTAQISDLLNEGVGAGWKTTEGLAKVFGLSMPEMFQLAADWAKAHPAPPETSTASKRRAHAAELAREDGVSEEAIRSVLDEPTSEEDAQRSTLWWALRMRRRDLVLSEAPPRRD